MYASGFWSMGRVLAIDVGTKRVGLALTDPLRITASPWGSLARDEKLWEVIRELCEQEGVDLVVVGYVANDYYGTASQMVEDFLEVLRSRVALPIVLQDESYSSVKAEAFIRHQKGKKRSTREDRDSLAATAILWEFLEEMERKEKKS